MVRQPIYMDNHATTRVDPRVVQAMLPYFTEHYGNAGSVGHLFGDDARTAVEEARRAIAEALGVSPRELVFTSGATESNNLAIFGIAQRQRRRGNHLLSVATEHNAVLDPLAHLGRQGFEITLLAVQPHGHSRAGWLDPQQVADGLRDDTILVSVMLANNEIGVLQPLEEIAHICRRRGVPLHCDATQAVGKVPLRLDRLPIDLLSFSGHKIYGPKGIGALVVRNVRLVPQIFGGGQEGGRRSGTLPVPLVVGLAEALRLCLEELPQEPQRLAGLRDRLFARLCEAVDGVQLNGPALDEPGLRLPGNLNCRFAHVDGEALLMSLRGLAVSSGAACSSADPTPSHVLRALGLSEDEARSSLRFGLGRFNTVEEVDFAAQAVADAVGRLRKLSSLA